MILYIFISCRSRIEQCLPRITKMMKDIGSDDYIVVVGGTETKEDKHLVHIDCNDYYEGLPEKVIKTFKFVHDNARFGGYTHFCKLDDDMVIRQLLQTKQLDDFSGKVNNSFDGNRRWHTGRCSTNSTFNTTEYKGVYVPWCAGGNGYCISLESMKILAIAEDYYDEIYEDVYVAKLLRDRQILPVSIVNQSEYLYSKDHS